MEKNRGSKNGHLLEARGAFVLLLQLFLVFRLSAQNNEFEIVRNNVYEVTKPAPERLQALNDSAAAYRNRQKADGSWADIDYSDRERFDGWSPRKHYERLNVMAKVYGIPECRLHNDLGLQKGVSNGLRFWYVRNPTSNNWIDTDMYVPSSFGVTMIYMRRGTIPLRRTLEDSICRKMRADGNPYKHVGANKTGMAIHWIYGASIQERVTLMDSAVSQMFAPIAFSTGEGLQRDYSHLQHNRQLHIHLYGESFARDSYSGNDMLRGTPWALADNKLPMVANFLKEIFLPAIRGRYADFNTVGRAIAYNDFLRRTSSIYDVLEPAKRNDPANNAVWDDAIQRLKGTQPPGDKIAPSHRSFWRADYELHQRPDYLFSVRTVSTRTVRTERTNNENLLGNFLPDGATNITRRGDEYFNIMPVWEWDKIPGITSRDFPTNDGARILKNYSHIWGSTSFVGGVSDSLHGARVYDMHFNSVAAKKAWFFFDREVVCLGAGIESSSAEKVATTLNQSWLKGDVTVKTQTGETLLSSQSATAFESPAWVFHDSTGYIIPNGGKVVIGNQNQSGNWKLVNGNSDVTNVSGDVFKAYFDHGANASNSSYAYIVVPGVGIDAVRSFPADRIKIASNTAKIQAVQNKELNIWQIIFHERGGFTSGDLNVVVDKPCILMLKNVGESQVTVFASDPTQLLKTLNIGIKTPQLGNQMRGVAFNLPARDLAGSTVKGVIDMNSPEQTPDTLSLPNLALGKPSKQSTTYLGSDAPRAVDGNTNGAWNAGSVTHTVTESTPSWWEVDLGAVATIASVNVYNRTDACCSSRLANYEVIVSLEPFTNGVVPASASIYPQSAVAVSPTSISVARIGRYVRIRQTAAQLPLSLAEVEVLGEWGAGTNLARSKPSKQSTTAYSGDASRAVDGNKNAAWSAQSVTHTSETESTPSWWEVDLGANANIGYINVFNRTDACCADKLKNYEVLVSGEPFGPGTSTPASASIYPQAAVAASPTIVKVGRTGRYVRIRHTVSKVPLSLAEVEVMGVLATKEAGARLTGLVEDIDNASQSGFADLYVIAPNPTFDQVVIRVGETNALKVPSLSENLPKTIQELVITDKFGKIVRQLKPGGVKELTVQVHDLQTGIYLIQIFDGSKWTSRKLLKVAR